MAQTTPTAIPQSEVVRKQFQHLSGPELRMLFESRSYLQIHAIDSDGKTAPIRTQSPSIPRALVLAVCITARRLGPKQNVWIIDKVRAPIVSRIIEWLQAMAWRGGCYPYPLENDDDDNSGLDWIPTHEILEHIDALYKLAVVSEVSMLSRSWHFLSPAAYIATWALAFDEGNDWASSSLKRHFFQYCNDRQTFDELNELQYAIQNIVSFPESPLIADVERSELKQRDARHLLVLLTARQDSLSSRRWKERQEEESRNDFRELGPRYTRH